MTRCARTEATGGDFIGRGSNPLPIAGDASVVHTARPVVTTANARQGYVDARCPFDRDPEAARAAMRGRRKATCDSGSYPTFVRLRTPRSCNANWSARRLTSNRCPSYQPTTEDLEGLEARSPPAAPLVWLRYRKCATGAARFAWKVVVGQAPPRSPGGDQGPWLQPTTTGAAPEAERAWARALRGRVSAALQKNVHVAQ